MARAGERVYDAIREGILGGNHAQGDRLTEEQLAAQLGVSRTPIREALRRLRAEGLVDFAPNRGAQVASWSAADLDEIFALRALLEGHASRLGAAHADAGDVARLRRLAERMTTVGRGDMDEVARLNSLFHRTVLELARNQRLIELLDSLVQMPLVHRTFHRYSPASFARSLAHHHELVDAIAVGDGTWAESVMRSHVHAARAALNA